MTICIAAICTWTKDHFWIVGTSDRMLSAPDIKFEPPQRKIYLFHPYAVALVAGDPYVQISICDETRRAHLAKPRETIREIAELYADAFSKYRRQNAEAKYLKPLGLDVTSFMEQSRDLGSDNVANLQHDLRKDPLDAEAIIAGIDATGPHLFVVSDPGVVACADSIGFASIGSGKAHADSYFMLSRYTRETLFHKALLDVYVAKKRSEVSPTVGPDTDIFYISPTGGGFWPFDDHKVHTELRNIRERLDRDIEIAHFMAEQEAWTFMEDYIKPRPQEPPPQPPESGPPQPKGDPEPPPPKPRIRVPKATTEPKSD